MNISPKTISEQLEVTSVPRRLQAGLSSRVRMRSYSERNIAITFRLSVCLSVTFRNCVITLHYMVEPVVEIR